MYTNKSITHINKFHAQRKISTVWFIFSFIVFLIFVVFTITNRFDKQTTDAWQWILQQVLPILTLITGVFLSSSKQIEKPKNIKRFYFKLTYYLSLGYFFLLLITILAMPIAINYASFSGYDFLKLSSVYLIPFLGIVTASLGIFFTKEDS